MTFQKHTNDLSDNINCLQALYLHSPKSVSLYKCGRIWSTYNFP